MILFHETVPFSSCNLAVSPLDSLFREAVNLPHKKTFTNQDAGQGSVSSVPSASVYCIRSLGAIVRIVAVVASAIIRVCFAENREKGAKYVCTVEECCKKEDGWVVERSRTASRYNARSVLLNYGGQKENRLHKKAQKQKRKSGCFAEKRIKLENGYLNNMIGRRKKRFTEDRLYEFQYQNWYWNYFANQFLTPTICWGDGPGCLIICCCCCCCIIKWWCWAAAVEGLLASCIVDVVWAVEHACMYSYY